MNRTDVNLIEFQISEIVFSWPSVLPSAFVVESSSSDYESRFCRSVRPCVQVVANARSLWGWAFIRVSCLMSRFILAPGLGIRISQSPDSFNGPGDTESRRLPAPISLTARVAFWKPSLHNAPRQNKGADGSFRSAQLFKERAAASC